MGRGSWSSAASSVMSQSSYVNVAVEGVVDNTTRQLTVDAEVYYTGSAPTGTQYLSVALLQNNVGGHQSDYGDYNPTGWKCPQEIYKHMHIFRMFVNPNNPNGDAISTTTGGVVSKQYTLTLPAMIANVPLELGELELVAFITEGSNLTTPIVSGNDGPITVTLNPGVTRADMSASANHIAPAGLCDNQFTPKMDVVNNSSSSITGVDVTYYINGTPTTVNLPSQTIAAGGTYTHTFPTTTLASGSNTIDYEVSLTDASKIDLSSLNNTSCSETIYVIPSTASGTTIVEGFESMSVGDDTPTRAIFQNPNGALDYVVDQSVSSTVTWNLGGFGNSSKSFRWRNYNNAAGMKSAIIYEKTDLSTQTGYQLSFNHAYAQYTNENDKFEVFVSTDCGANWTSIWSKQGSSLATAPATTAAYYAQTTDWVNNIVSLSAYENETELMFKFEGTSAYGNNLYVDDINVTNSVGIDEEVTENSISIFPNPTNSISTISFTLSEAASVKMEVYNTMGSMVYSNGTETMNAGNQKVIFDGSELPNGIYFVNLTIGDQLITKKVSLLK